MNSKLKKTVLAALMASITAVVGRLIVIPLPGNGFLNIGDSMVCLCGIVLGPVWGSVAAGLGGLLTDLLAGYASYAPATFVIKLLMGFICGLVSQRENAKGAKKLLLRLLSGSLAECIMIGGYFLFEWAIYDVGVAALDIAGNALQGGASLIAFVIIAEITERINFKRRLS